MTVEEIDKFIPWAQLKGFGELDPDPRSDDVVALAYNDMGIVCKMKDGTVRNLITFSST